MHARQERVQQDRGTAVPGWVSDSLDARPKPMSETSKSEICVAPQFGTYNLHEYQHAISSSRRRRHGTRLNEPHSRDPEGTPAYLRDPGTLTYSEPYDTCRCVNGLEMILQLTPYPVIRPHRWAPAPLELSCYGVPCTLAKYAKHPASEDSV